MRFPPMFIDRCVGSDYSLAIDLVNKCTNFLGAAPFDTVEFDKWRRGANIPRVCLGAANDRHGMYFARPEATHLELRLFAAEFSTGAARMMMRDLFETARKKTKRGYVRFETPTGAAGLWEKPPEVRPEWVDSNVRSLARRIADTWDAHAVPILADALQDAGCDDDGLLSDLRELGLGPLVFMWICDTITGAA